MTGELGRWVLQASCRQLSTWHETFGEDRLHISVNASPAQLITSDFVQTVSRTLHGCGLVGRHLTVEVTEQAIVRDTTRAFTTLQGLREPGVKIAIDDFGTGYSSFSQLKDLPVDVLKIDRSFVQHLGQDDRDLAIVTSIIVLAKSLGLDVVAEGVDTVLAATTLLQLGCRRAQGYLFSQPVASPDFSVAFRQALT